MLAVALVAAAPADAREKKKRPERPVEVQLLGINDFHGHLESATSGRIGRNTVRRRDRVPAGGAEYLATHVRLLSRRRPEHARGLCRRPGRRQPAAFGSVP